jgi:hypothetical protein
MISHAAPKPPSYTPLVHVLQLTAEGGVPREVICVLTPASCVVADASDGMPLMAACTLLANVVEAAVLGAPATHAAAVVR